VAWFGRTSLRVRIAAGVAGAAVIAAIVFVAVPSSSAPKPAYSSLPSPCSLVSLATVARYLPNPTGTPLTTSVPRTVRAGACKWSSTTDGEDRTLEALVVIVGSSSAVTTAQQSYNATASALGCHCKGVSVSTRPVTGLGDGATALFITPGPDPDFLNSANASDPGTNLIVWSSNAELTLQYNATAAGTVLPPDTATLAWLVSAARGILADLARPAAVSAAPVAPEPHYAGSRDPCRLITTATLAKYAPGAAVTTDTSASPSKDPSGARTSTCNWLSGSVYIMLRLGAFPDAASAQQGFIEEARGFSQSGNGLAVTGTRWLTDLGEQAVALDQTRASEHGVEILVWSGTIELDYWYASTGSSPPDRATLLAGGIAMARDGLAALATPGASSYPHGPVYANPHDACPLVKASTLARYTPGATVDQTPIPNLVGPELSTCSWTAPSATLILSVTVDADADGALGYYQIALQQARQDQIGIRFDGRQSVPRLGDQATAVFATQASHPEVDLYVLSGNADVEMSISDLPLGPTLSRGQKLAADIAVIRDVLADLRRT
jgi:hypothetical protein